MNSVGLFGPECLFSETTVQKANQHERKLIEKLYDKPQYGRDQKDRQLENEKKSLGLYSSVFTGR